MDSATFDRLAESCEDAIRVRLADFGAGAHGPAAFAGEPRAALRRLLGSFLAAAPADAGPERPGRACIAAALHYFAESGFLVDEIPNPHPPGPSVFHLRTGGGGYGSVVDEAGMIEQGRAILAAAGRAR